MRKAIHALDASDVSYVDDAVYTSMDASAEAIPRKFAARGRSADDVIRKFAMTANNKRGKTEALLERGPKSRETQQASAS